MSGKGVTIDSKFSYFGGLIFLQKLRGGELTKKKTNYYNAMETP